jgi:hypothetical protein
MRSMRSPVDLADLPYAFTQLSLLGPDEFRRQALDRRVPVTDDQLEALHRLRILIPLLRVSRSRRALMSLIRPNDIWARGQALWRPTATEDVIQAHAEHALHDPSSERFIPLNRRRLTLNGRSYPTTVYLYSQHQLITLPLVSEVLPYLRPGRHDDPSSVRLAIQKPWKQLWTNTGARLRDIVIAASALEAPYWVSVTGTLRLRTQVDPQQFEEWRFSRPIKAALRWLGVKPSWLLDAAAELHRRADRLDSLGSWTEVVANASPERWSDLRGDARTTVDLRATAELFLRYYEDLAERRQARALPRTNPRERGQFHRRLKKTRSLDELLTYFGLSPHPRLVLVVEGDTEFLLVPRVMKLVVTDTDEEIISVQNAGGVGADLGILMGLVAPRIVDDEDEQRFLSLARPATRVLVVFDPEPPVTDDKARERRRQGWVDRILRSLPREHRTEQVRDQVDILVKATTWNRKGESFEFAHFTDLQLARAIAALPGHRNPPSLEQLKQRVSDVRRREGNLKELFPRASKVELAEQLWPVLEARVTRVLRTKDPHRVPIVRVLDEAVALAYELPRHGLVIGLRPNA